MRRLALATAALLSSADWRSRRRRRQLADQLPSLDLNNLIPSGEGAFTGRIVQLILLLTVLSVAPGLLIMVTSFTRFIVALSFLRAGLGMQSTPANLILISLALFMTFFVMQPTFERAYETGLQPLLANQIDEAEAYTRITEPFRAIHAGARTRARSRPLPRSGSTGRCRGAPARRRYRSARGNAARNAR